jgi:hypothetical protein
MTERIVSSTRIQGAARETENQEVFLSLPVLMRQKETAVPHGVVLKPLASQPPDAPKTTLLTPKIDAETEIPEEAIRSLPRAMDGVYRNFKGAYCTDKNVTLILDPKKLLEAKI